jgi:vitamin B12 transporter
MLHLYLIAAIVGVASPPQSEPPPPDEVPVVEDQIVVSATLEQESLRDLPASVTLIDRDQIRDRQAVGIAEMLRTVPGLAVVQSGSPGKVVSVFSRGAESNQALVLWNGMRLNDPYFGGFDWAQLSTDGVDRIEVVRGPASSLYGSDAMGGVVQILTGSSHGGALRLEGGEDSYGRLGGSWSGDVGRARIDIAGHSRRGDGAADNDFYDSDEATARLGWQVGRQASLGLMARYSQSEIGIPVASGTPTPRRTQEADALHLAIPFEADFGNWHLTASLSHLDAGLVFLDPEAVFSRSETDAERLRLRSVATYRANETLSISAGGDWENERVTNDTNFGLNLDDEARDNYSVFGEMQKTWGRLRLDLGARQDEDEFFGGALSPRAGLLFEASDGVQVFANYGEGFRAPSLGELFFPFFGNVDLEPEESRTWEAGLRFTSGAWRFEMAAFTSEFRNLIDSDPLNFTAINVGEAETEGLELAVSGRRGIVSGSAQLTLLTTEDLATGESLLRRPETSGSVVVTVRPEPFSATLVTRYVGERDDLDPLTFLRAVNDSYFVADLAVSWRVSPSLLPYARLKNIADEEYQEVLGFPAPGRTFIVGLEVGIR